MPKRRRLNAEEQTSVRKMLDVHANKWLIHQHIVKATGKIIFKNYVLIASNISSFIPIDSEVIYFKGQYIWHLCYYLLLLSVQYPFTIFHFSVTINSRLKSVYISNKRLLAKQFFCCASAVSTS